MSEEAKSKDKEHKYKCTICQKAVSLPKGHHQKMKEKEEEKKARQNGGGSNGGQIRIKYDESADLDEGVRMRLCGCLFCKECFEFFIHHKLDQQKG